MINWIKADPEKEIQFPVLVTWSGYVTVVHDVSWFKENDHLPVTHYAHINLPGEDKADDQNGL